MKEIEKIISRGIKIDPVPLRLVLNSYKPASFIMFKKSKLNYNSVLYRIYDWPQNSGVKFFLGEHGKYIYIFAFNISLIKKQIVKINTIQEIQFSSPEKLVEYFRKIYKNKLKNIKKNKKQYSLDLIQGIIFGFPYANVLKFREEMISGKLRKDRKFYNSSLSSSLVFVGYKTTVKSSKRLLLKWKNAYKAISKLSGH